ncbi:kdm8, partial [Symbiodinium pilosum]
FWASRHGHRTIPIEMGFAEDDAQSRELQQSTASEGSFIMNDFVMKYLLPSNESSQRKLEDWPSEAIDAWSVSEVAYMAQHQLLMQIPELRSDIAIPHFCSLGKLQTVNVWIGTAGTVTALHYDLDDNFLVQVAGF